LDAACTYYFDDPEDADAFLLAVGGLALPRTDLIRHGILGRSVAWRGTGAILARAYLWSGRRGRTTDSALVRIEAVWRPRDVHSVESLRGDQIRAEFARRFHRFLSLPPVQVITLADAVQDVVRRHDRQELSRQQAERLLGAMILAPRQPKRSVDYLRDRERLKAGYAPLREGVATSEVVDVAAVFRACFESHHWESRRVSPCQA
jgi:hypothetical protein